jgi:hypothetical protein
VLRAANNLSDVASVATARANLAIDSTTTAFSGATTAVVALTSGFNEWELVLQGLVPSVASTVSFQFSFDNGATYKAGASDYAYSRINWNNTPSAAYSVGVSTVPLTSLAVDATASKANDFFMRIFGPKAAGFGSSFQVTGQYWQGTANSDLSEMVNGQVTPGYGTPTHLKFTSSGGNIAGSFRVRGKG